MKFRFIASGLLVLLPLLASCGDSPSAPVPSRIVITPGNVSMNALGLTQQFSASVEDGKGRPVTGVSITWNSTNSTVASVSSSGLATGLTRGTASIQASAEGLTASASLTVAPVPAAVIKISGDSQTGALSQPLSQELEVEVTDSQGNPIGGQVVNFGIVAGAGTLSPSSATTNAQGLATTVWTLGCSNDNPQRVVATSSGISVEFTAEADLSLPAICQSTVPDGRETVPYSVELVAVGGDPNTMAWTIQSGALPGGLNLSAGGLLAGTPTEAGSFTFRALAQDGMGNSAFGDFGLRICDAPITLSPGGTVTVPAAGADGCGLFLPAGSAGDRYRLGVIWSTSNENDATNSPTVTVSATKTLAAGVSPQLAPIRVLDRSSPVEGDWTEGLPEHFQQALEVEAATEAYHYRLREAEWELIRSLGPDARLLPARPALQRVSGPQAAAPEKLSLFANPANSCSASTAKVTALLVAENDQVAFYQDSAQAQIDSLKISSDLATQMLDYYRDYGEQVIDQYFGGITDINNDGQVVVFVTPVVEDGVAAYVWSGDFFSTESCSASNEMELVRFNANTVRGVLTGNFQALATLVHEVQHISSLYKSIGRLRYYATGGVDPGYHPTWIEEGRAEIAGEMSSRLAWAATGGPAVGEMIVRADKFPITKEKYGVLLKWVRTIFHLGLQPNGLVATPAGADEDHTLYGSGWHFHRWLGDAYGNAASAMADGPLFTVLTDSLTASGPQGIKDVTGKLWNELMDEYVSALLLVGTGAPRPAWGFTSYDFPDVTTGLLQTQRPGFYPWPVNVSGDNTTMTFSSFLSMGTIGPSGIRVYDLTSDGVGIGLEVEVDTTRDPIRIIVVRIQ